MNFPRRFKLKSLFVAVLLGCIYLGFAQTAGYWVMLGFVLAGCSLAWAVCSRQRGVFFALRLTVGLAAIIIIWFLAVDWSWFVEDCPDCHLSRDNTSYRLLGIPIHTKVHDVTSVVDFTLTRLGVPCRHRRMERWHKHRWWGGLMCACPCINGISGFTGLIEDDEYREMVANKMQQHAHEDPRFASDLYDHVITKHDYKYFWHDYERIGGVFPGDGSR
jgi:hypothetical protein